MDAAHQPGWYPDPVGRYEFRYHNGRDWTGDVSLGGQRYVDPVSAPPAPGTWTGPAGPTPPTPGSTGPSGTNSMAIAALVLGIAALAIAWMPFVFVGGVLAAVLAIVFAAIGLRRARRSQVGRGAAIAGLATGVVALGVAAFGAWFTVVFVDAFDRYDHPADHTVSLDRCGYDDAGSSPAWHAVGTVTNEGDVEADFSIDVAFVRVGTDNAQRTIELSLDDVAPGAAAPFDAVWPTTAVTDGLDCLVEVHGPLPFGIDPD